MTSTDVDVSKILVAANDGHCWNLLACIPQQPKASLLWLPALGVAARHYLPFAKALAAYDVAVFLHEWRGHGSSNLRASSKQDWGYRELLQHDLPGSDAAVRIALPNLPQIHTSRVIGGHSLGGQLASCYLATASTTADGLWLLASGSPYWRMFPRPKKALLPLIYRFLPWLADRNGVLPGRRIGFGGNEARGVVRDWARTGLSGRYAGAGITIDLEAALAHVQTRASCVVLRDDWLAPRSSLDFLLAKMPRSTTSHAMLDADALGTRADHFAWMPQPQAVADTFMSLSK